MLLIQSSTFSSHSYRLNLSKELQFHGLSFELALHLSLQRFELDPLVCWQKDTTEIRQKFGNKESNNLNLTERRGVLCVISFERLQKVFDQGTSSCVTVLSHVVVKLFIFGLDKVSVEGYRKAEILKLLKTCSFCELWSFIRVETYCRLLLVIYRPDIFHITSMHSITYTYLLMINQRTL